MQNIFSRSSLTYEWTQLTPSSAFRSTTARHSAAASPLAGIGSPSVNVRSTRYRGISRLPRPQQLRIQVGLALPTQHGVHLVHPCSFGPRTFLVFNGRRG